jgi:DNA polymerase-3 subunit alpha
MIRYGLGAIKGTGQAAIDAIISRSESGPFSSLFDFCVRVDRSRVNKRCIEALIKAGAFDSLQLNRASLIASVDRAVDFANATQANANQTACSTWMATTATAPARRSPIWWRPRHGASRSG